MPENDKQESTTPEVPSYQETLESTVDAITKRIESIKKSYEESALGKFDKTFEQKGLYEADKEMLESVRSEYPQIGNFIDNSSTGNALKELVKDYDKSFDDTVEGFNKFIDTLKKEYGIEKNPELVKELNQLDKDIEQNSLPEQVRESARKFADDSILTSEFYKTVDSTVESFKNQFSEMRKSIVEKTAEVLELEPTTESPDKSRSR